MFLTDNEYMLFSKYSWHKVSNSRKAKLKEEVASIEGNRLLNTSVEALCTYLIGKYSVNVPLLKRDDIVIDQNEVPIDVSRDPMRSVDDRSRPAYVSGTEIEVTVPFDGDEGVFKIQPSTFTPAPPQGYVYPGELRFCVSGATLVADKVKAKIESTLDQIDECLGTLRRDATNLNFELPTFARDSVETRRARLLADQNLVSSLGYNVKQREGNTRTYPAPDVRRKVTPVLPPASSKPYKPEPELPLDEFEHIIEVIQSMAQVIERSPAEFASMKEETLRSHFLVQLNGHYEGQATGETFNFEGKTDILIRSEGKNIFIAEGNE